MEKIIRQIVDFLSSGIEAILKFLSLVWTWSFGQIITIFQSNWQALPFWKLFVLAIVSITIAYLLFRALREIWSAAEGVFRSFVALLSAFVTVLPWVVGAGLTAFAGGWLIQNLNFG